MVNIISINLFYLIAKKSMILLLIKDTLELMDRFKIKNKNKLYKSYFSFNISYA